MSAPTQRLRRVADGPTLDEVRCWPATVDIPQACEAIGFSRGHGYNLAREGRFPALVIKAGGRMRVVTASLVRLLDRGDT